MIYREVGVICAGKRDFPEGKGLNESKKGTAFGKGNAQFSFVRTPQQTGGGQGRRKWGNGKIAREFAGKFQRNSRRSFHPAKIT